MHFGVAVAVWPKNHVVVVLCICVLIETSFGVVDGWFVQIMRKLCVIANVCYKCITGGGETIQAQIIN